MMKSFMSMKVNKGRDVRKEKTTKLGFLKGIFRASLSIPKKNRISFIIIWVFSKSSFEFQSITSSERTPFFVYCGDGRLFVTVDRFWSPILMAMKTIMRREICPLVCSTITFDSSTLYVLITSWHIKRF